MSRLEIPRIPHRMTLEEYRELPEGPPFFELIDGELIMAPAPNVFHQEITGNIFSILREHVSEHGLGKVFVAPLDVTIGRDCFEPDVIFVGSDRLVSILRPDGIEGAPDLLVEVLSESTYRRDLTRKRAKYAEGGVREYWIVDPEEQTLRRFDFAMHRENPVAVYAQGASFTSDLFPGLSVSLADVFRR